MVRKCFTWILIPKYLRNILPNKPRFPVAAIAWMCRNQLGRRNLTNEQKTYLIGKQYEAQKMTQGTNNQYVKAKSESHHFGDFQSGKTKDIIAREHGIGSTSVERAEQFAHGLDAADEVAPGIREAVLSGDIKAPKSIISEIRNVPPPCAALFPGMGQTSFLKTVNLYFLQAIS